MRVLLYTWGKQTSHIVDIVQVAAFRNLTWNNLSCDEGLVSWAVQTSSLFRLYNISHIVLKLLIIHDLHSSSHDVISLTLRKETFSAIVVSFIRV